MVKVYRATQTDARVLVSNEGRAYLLSGQRRSMFARRVLPGLQGIDPDVEALEGTRKGYVFREDEPTITNIQPLEAGSGYRVTTTDGAEILISPGQAKVLLDDL